MPQTDMPASGHGKVLEIEVGGNEVHVLVLQRSALRDQAFVWLVGQGFCLPLTVAAAAGIVTSRRWCILRLRGVEVQRFWVRGV